MIRKMSISVVLVLLVWGCSKSTDDLIQDLRSSSSRVRQKAGVTLMGRRGNSETVQKLIQVLNDKDMRVAFIAAQILGSMSDTTAVMPLGNMLGNPNSEFRARVCWSLGSIGHESALPFLVKELSDSSSAVRHSAITAIGALYHYPPASQYIYAMFRDPADSVRAAAVASHYNFRNVKESGVRAADLATPLTDRNDLVRYVTVQALGGGYPDTTVAGDLLIDALKDTNKHVRLEAIASLQKIGYAKAVPYLKGMYDTATVDEEYAITEAIKVISDETYPPVSESN
ncbi:HEAT repeat domain-containing protein [bacterium]|nr:HEAT repeat domain-containing protein [bacterium]